MHSYYKNTEIPKHLIKTPERMEKISEVAIKRQNDLTIVLENVHDPHNISACIRSCDAVGISQIHVINTIQPKPYRRLGKKTSAGSIKWVNVKKWRTVEECFSILKADGFKVYTTALGEESSNLYNLDLTNKTALVFGNEHDGVSKNAQNLADGNYIIPQMGMIESLNISVACAVSLFEAMRQKEKAGHYSYENRERNELEANLISMLEC